MDNTKNLQEKIDIKRNEFLRDRCKIHTFRL